MQLKPSDIYFLELMEKHKIDFIKCSNIERGQRWRQLYMEMVNGDDSLRRNPEYAHFKRMRPVRDNWIRMKKKAKMELAASMADQTEPCELAVRVLRAGGVLKSKNPNPDGPGSAAINWDTMIIDDDDEGDFEIDNESSVKQEFMFPTEPLPLEHTILQPGADPLGEMIDLPPPAKRPAKRKGVTSDLPSEKLDSEYYAIKAYQASIAASEAKVGAETARTRAEEAKAEAEAARIKAAEHTRRAEEERAILIRLQIEEQRLKNRLLLIECKAKERERLSQNEFQN